MNIIGLSYSDRVDEHGIPAYSAMDLVDVGTITVVETHLWDWQQVHQEQPNAPHVFVPYVTVEVIGRGTHRLVIGRFRDVDQAIRELDAFVDWLRQPKVQLTPFVA